jgi:hypothetical protein
MATRKHLGFEQLETRLAFAASIVESQQIGYFFDSQSNIVGRYDIESEIWYGSIVLHQTTKGPDVVHVDSEGIYAGFGQTIYRYHLDGTEKTHIINLRSPVVSIHSDGDILFLNYSSSAYIRILSIDKNSNQVIDSVEISSYYYTDPPILSIATQGNTIYGVSSWYSSLRFFQISYNQGGTFGQNRISTLSYGEYTNERRSWVVPDESKLIHSAGGVFAISDLRYLSRLNPIDDIDYFQDQIPFVLKGSQVTAYSKSFLPTGQATLNDGSIKIFVNDFNVIAFIADESHVRKYRTQVIPISDFNPVDPNAPIDPTGLAYTPDWIAVSNQARLLLFSKSHQNIFVWNPMLLGYERSIGLLGSPNALAYDPVSDLIYVAYESGLIYTVDLSKPNPTEVPFLSLPGRPIALCIAGDFLFAVDYTSYQYNHRVISKLGTIESTKVSYDSPGSYTWNPTNQSVYSLRSGSYPNGLMYEPIDPLGHLMPAVYSPYYESTGFIQPIRFPSDGKTILIGSGMIFDAKTLVRSPYSLANSISDAVWFSGRWVTIRNVAGDAQLQEWIGQTFEPVYAKQWSNSTAHSLHVLTSRRIVATRIASNGIPYFSIMDEHLQPAAVNNTWHNHDAPMDVDDDEFVSPLDILIMIDQINLYGARQTVNVGEHYCDADNDGVITPLDILDVIDWINLQESNESKPSGESEPSIDDLMAYSVDELLMRNRKARLGLANTR